MAQQAHEHVGLLCHAPAQHMLARSVQCVSVAKIMYMQKFRLAVYEPCPIAESRLEIFLHLLVWRPYAWTVRFASARLPYSGDPCE